MSKRSTKQKQITVVFNIDDNEEEEVKPNTKAKKQKPVVLPDPEIKKKRGRKKSIPMFKGKLETLQDMIQLAEEEVIYSNIDVTKLMVIKQELKDLHQLIGLENIKRTIFEQLVFYLQHLHEGSEMYLNTVIYGPPGTGKTTVAKIMGSMFSKLNIIKTPEYDDDYDDYEDEEEDDEEYDKFYMLRRDDLVGEYLGSTSIKTQETLQSCLGGVIFIDEVYSLGNKDGTDSFAKEAIDTMNLFLSENKDYMMMIVAGYKEEINNCFFKYNEGLRRRFMWYHTIEPYTAENLRDIFLSKLEQSEWTYDDKVTEYMLQTIRNHKELFPDNAGSIENFITLVKIKHGKRVLLLSMEHKKKITIEDIKNALTDQTKEKKQEEFMNMYM